MVNVADDWGHPLRGFLFPTNFPGINVKLTVAACNFLNAPQVLLPGEKQQNQSINQFLKLYVTLATGQPLATETELRDVLYVLVRRSVTSHPSSSKVANE